MPPHRPPEDHDSSDDSSDEDVAAAPNPYASLGSESISQLIERSAELKKATKKNYKSSKNVKIGAPSTVAAKFAWQNKFEGYRRSMKHTPERTPTGKDLHMFMDSMVQITKPIGGTALSYSWFHRGLSVTMEYCHGNWDDFKLDKQDSKKLVMLSERFLNAGVLTKDPKREKQWLGCRVVQRCVDAMLKDALDEGTRSWDVLLCKAASLVLISALGRGGDVLRSQAYSEGKMEKFHAYQAMTAPEMIDNEVSRDQLYAEIPFLRYEDITIKLLDDGPEASFSAEFIMCQDKGEKGSRKNKTSKRTVRMRSQQSSGDNTLDPIDYVLILALRFGVVAERTMEDLIRSTRGRRDRIVQWVRPDAPVLPAFTPSSAGVVYDKPAPASQALDTLRRAAELAGIPVHVIVHDIRRGAADDITYLPSAPRLNVEGVGQLLGHSDKTVRAGVTRKVYMGKDRRDVWSERLQNPTINDDHGIEMIPGGFKRKRNSTKDVKEVCEEQGFDYNTPGGKKRARTFLVQQQMSAVIQGGRQSSDSGMQTPAKQALAEKSTNIQGKKMATSADEDALDPRLLVSTKSLELLESFRYKPPGQTIHVSTARDLPVDTARDIALDPAHDHNESWEMLPVESDDVDRDHTGDEAEQSGLYLAELVHGTQAASDELIAFIDPLCESDLEISKTWAELVKMSGLDFISTLSKINLVRSESRNWSSFSVSGGSRDEPSLFLVKCPNHIFGCTKTFERADDIRSHWPDHCKSTSIEEHIAEEERQADRAVAAASAETFKCDECDQTFVSDKRLRQHKIEHSETWTPRACGVEGCKQKKVFQSREQLLTHHNENHSMDPTECPLHEDPMCGDEPGKLYTVRRTLKKHLQRKHKLSNEEVTKHVPKIQAAKGVRRSMPDE